MTLMKFHGGTVLRGKPLQACCCECIRARTAPAVGMPLRDVTAIRLLELGKRTVRFESELAIEINEIGLVHYRVIPLGGEPDVSSGVAIRSVKGGSRFRP